MTHRPPLRDRVAACARLVLVAFCLWPGSLLACATCFGASSDPMARGMTMGILALLGVVMFVLGGIAAFGIFLVRRAAKFSQAPTAMSAEPAPVTEVGAVDSLISEPIK